MHKIPDEVIKELIIDKSMTDDQAARYLGVSRMTVSRRRVKLDIDKKPKRPNGYYELTEEQDRQIKNLFSDGKNDYEVAKIMHLGRNRLREWRKERGISSKSNKKGLTERDAEKALIMRNSGSTYEQIANEFGVKRSSIAKLLSKNGYEEKEPYRPASPGWAKYYNLTDDQKSVIKSISSYVTSEAYGQLSDNDKARVVDELCQYYRKKGFPYPRSNKRELLKLYKSFSDKNNEVAAFKICNHFMPHRFDCRRYDSNPMEHWDNDNLFRKFIINRLTYGQGYISDSVIRTGLQLKGVVANFSPKAARQVYDNYLPEGGSSLDFSSGFGGRLIGFMTSKRTGSYTGVEPFSKSYRGLEEMKAYFSDQVFNKKINLICSPFEDTCKIFKDNSFNLVFSSPPYYGLEVYSEDSTQSLVRYPEYKDWLNSFWFLILKESFRVIKRSGHLIFSIGNYKTYDLISATKKYISELGFVEKDPLNVSYKNVYRNYNKQEKVFVYQKM